jgi:catechol 2,3-dioxygenase
MAIDVDRLKSAIPPAGMPFRISKIGHVVLRVSELQRAVDFYTRILGFKVSDVYPEDMVPGGMVFMRFGPDHHGLALVGKMEQPASKRELDHLAFEVATLDEVFRARALLREHNVPILFHGRRRAGAQIAVEFFDPDQHHLEIYWGIDQIGSAGQVRSSSEWNWAQSLEEALAHPVPNQDAVLIDRSLLDPH